MTYKALLCGALLSLSLSLSSVAHADIIVSDLNEDVAVDNDTTSELIMIKNTERLAAGFITDGNAYTLDAITLFLDQETPGTISPTVTLQLFNSALGGGGFQIPTGSAIGTFNTNVVSQTTFENEIFSPTVAGSITLAANTIYWIVISSNAGDSNVAMVNWAGDPTPTNFFVGQPGTVVLDFLKSTSSSDEGWNSNTDRNALFRVEGTPVPEPASLALMALGVLGMVIFYARRMI